MLHNNSKPIHTLSRGGVPIRKKNASQLHCYNSVIYIHGCDKNKILDMKGIQNGYVVDGA